MHFGKERLKNVWESRQLRIYAASLAVAIIWASAEDKSSPPSERLHGVDYFWNVAVLWLRFWVYTFVYGLIATMFHHVFTDTDRDFYKQKDEWFFYAWVGALIPAAFYWAKAYHVFGGASLD